MLRVLVRLRSTSRLSLSVMKSHMSFACCSKSKYLNPVLLKTNFGDINVRYLRGRSRQQDTEERTGSEPDEEQSNENRHPQTDKKYDFPTNVKFERVEELFKNSANLTDKNNKDDAWLSSPYPVNVESAQSQAKHSFRPGVDPRETSVILFPGQGAQFVGMGAKLLDYPNVRDMFTVASDILKYDLLEICQNGPMETLSRTMYCQPAVLVVSLAAVEKLKHDNPEVLENCVATAGFSIGEIAALVFAGAISFEHAVNLVKVRAEAMQAAAELTPSGMMTVIYGPDSHLKFACLAAKEWCKKQGIENAECSVANYLFPHCKVIAGNDEALDFVKNNLADFKLRRVKRLPVSGAFHTSLMKPALEPMRAAMKLIKIKDPMICVHSNLNGQPYHNARHILANLPKQMCAPVRWEQTMHVIYERPADVPFPQTYECGPGAALRTILRNVNLSAWKTSRSVEV